MKFRDRSEYDLRILQFPLRRIVRRFEEYSDAYPDRPPVFVGFRAELECGHVVPDRSLAKRRRCVKCGRK